MFGLGEKNYASLVGPLKKMASDLVEYIAEQREKISILSGEKTDIESKIQISENEIAKSEFTTGKIGELVVLDLDENGIADIEELPEDDEEPPDNDTESET